MDISVTNCNNILRGHVHLVEGALNLKYAINGTGKTTIAKAIVAATQQNVDALKRLTPYVFQQPNADPEQVPTVSGVEKLRKVMVFDETYIDQYVYQPGELIKNSFEIFVKTPDYDNHILQIQNLLEEIRMAFNNNPDLESLITVFSQFLDGCGKSQTGLSAAGSIIKGLGKGNKVENIPSGLEAYKPYLSNTQNATNVKWLKWQSDGKAYLDIAEQCPYCTGSITSLKKNILRISEEFDSKAIEHLNKMLSVFEQLSPYCSESTNDQISIIKTNAGNMNTQQKNYLYEIKQQVETVLEALLRLKNLGFQSLKNVDQMAAELNSYIIDLALFSHLQSSLTHKKIEVINRSLAIVVEKAGQLQGEINRQNRLIKQTIDENETAINDFLKCAGFEYMVDIEEKEQKYRMVLKPAAYNTEVSSVKDHLSFGERNALALVLFMFTALKENPDLVILDDPISSFDGNKKFALLNMLFLSNKCLRNRTVLMLTHDFNTVIDVIYTMSQNFSPFPSASFLYIKKGILEEKMIEKHNIKSFRQIALDNINANIDSLNKLIYLRRLLEIERAADDLAWHLLSNLFHKRAVPELHGASNRPMTEDEITQASIFIRKFIPTFDYSKEYMKTQDLNLLTRLYENSTSNYEKLQLYRIIYNENHDNPVIKKYINETFHVENDSLFQLNPRDYNTIPQFIIDECDADIQKMQVN